MRNLLLLIVGLSVATTSLAFRDITERSSLYPAVDYLIENEILEDGAFLRQKEAVPRGFFWRLLLNDAGVNFDVISEKIILPPNINKGNAMAGHIRAAIAAGFVDPTKDFLIDGSIKRIEAIKFLTQSKKIILPTHVSAKFREKVGGIPPTAQYLRSVEAAYASGILKDNDIEKLRPYDNLKREELIRWLYNWHINGEIKKSTIVPPKTDDSPYPQYRYEKRQNIKNRIPKQKKIEFNIEGLLKKQDGQDIAVLEEVMNQIRRKFRFQDTLDDARTKKMINQATARLVEGLEDKYSSYIEPEKAEDFKDNLNGKFEGIGAYVEMVENKFTITSPITGSPAELAGIKAGDIVTKVNGESIKDLSIGETIKKIKGPAGTEVRLWILRNERGREITVIRGEITIPPLKLKWKNGLPIVGIHQFSRDTGFKLEKMLKDEILSKNPRGIVFDLRNNPGGFLTAAVDVGGIFLNKEVKVFSAEYKDHEEVFFTKKQGVLANFDKPMVFLQNKGSASASEILTAMIQDYEIGKIIGTTSLGKGTVQEIIQFTNGGSLKLTVAKWISPKGRWIHEKGVEADIIVDDPSEKDKKNKIDHQLERAIRAVLER